MDEAIQTMCSHDKMKIETKRRKKKIFFKSKEHRLVQHRPLA